MKELDSIWSEDDRNFIEEVERIVRRQRKEQADELLARTQFYDLLYEDPFYVNHYEPAYWADYIIHGDVEEIDRT